MFDHWLFERMAGWGADRWCGASARPSAPSRTPPCRLARPMKSASPRANGGPGRAFRPMPAPCCCSFARRVAVPLHGEHLPSRNRLLRTVIEPDAANSAAHGRRSSAARKTSRGDARPGAFQPGSTGRPRHRCSRRPIARTPPRALPPHHAGFSAARSHRRSDTLFTRRYRGTRSCDARSIPSARPSPGIGCSSRRRRPPSARRDQRPPPARSELTRVDHWHRVDAGARWHRCTRTAVLPKQTYGLTELGIPST